MKPVVKYAGRERTGPSEWTVSLDLVDADTVNRYWFEFRTAPYSDIDVDMPNFWGYLAYLGGKFIENRQFFDEESGELLSPAEEAAAGAPLLASAMSEPQVGDVCWKF